MLVKFYKDAFNQTSILGYEVPVLNNAEVRTEFALLFYDQSEFQIHEKADAFEALDKMLSIIHAWLASCSL